MNAFFKKNLLSIASLSLIKGCLVNNKKKIKLFSDQRISDYLLDKVKEDTYSKKVMFRQIKDFIMWMRVMTLFNELCIFFCAMGLLHLCIVNFVVKLFICRFFILLVTTFLWWRDLVRE